MDTQIRALAYVLGDNVDTDQIIPAQYLVYNPAVPEEYRMFGRYALSGVPKAQAGLPDGGMPFVREGEFTSDYQVIVAGKNFGCGSSREHAPIALHAAGVKAVIAQSYARIFFRNAVNGGYVIPLETDERLIERIRTGELVEVDIDACRVTNLTTGQSFSLRPLGDVRPIIEAGGIFRYAERAGMLRGNRARRN